MIDEIFDRTYQAGRTEMNATISSGLLASNATAARVFMLLLR